MRHLEQNHAGCQLNTCDFHMERVGIQLIRCQLHMNCHISYQCNVVMIMHLLGVSL